MDVEEVESRIREVCLALPDVTEKLSHGAPAFFVKRQFVALWSRGHHEHEFAHMWCAAAPDTQQMLINASNNRLFYPPYVGHRGWIGIRLDGDVDFDEIEMHIDDAYRSVATASQIAKLDGLSR